MGKSVRVGLSTDPGKTGTHVKEARLHVRGLLQHDEVPPGALGGGDLRVGARVRAKLARFQDIRAVSGP